MSISYLQSLIDETSEALDRAPQDHQFIRDARSQLWMAQQMLDQGKVSTDGTTDKAVNFAWRAHIYTARRAYQMVMAEPRLERDNKRQAGTRKGRRKAWPELRQWIREQDPELTANQLWELVPEEGAEEIGAFERVENKIVGHDGKEIKSSRFANIVSEERNPESN